MKALQTNSADEQGINFARRTESCKSEWTSRLLEILTQTLAGPLEAFQKQSKDRQVSAHCLQDTSEAIHMIWIRDAAA